MVGKLKPRAVKLFAQHHPASKQQEQNLELQTPKTMFLTWGMNCFNSWCIFIMVIYLFGYIGS